MPRRIAPTLIVTVVAVSLLAGCTAGSNGVSAPATLGQGTPRASATPAAAAVSKVSPVVGGVTGGTTITLTGSNLGAVDRVKIGTQDATDVKVVSDSKVTAVVPRAVDYQPASGDIVAYAGSKPVSAAATASYTWKVSSGVDREMQYAFAHWNAPTYNASYLDFNSVGGDCQNFVSQALDARGLAQNDSWHYNSSGHSETWGYAPAFDNYLKANPSLGFTPLTADQRSELSVGDLAYFDWNNNDVPDHVMIVSAIDGSKISLVGHNLDYDYRDLDTAITKDHPGAKVWFYKVPASL